MHWFCAFVYIALTLIVQLEDAHAPLRRGAIVDGQRVGGTADHLSFHQQRVIGQDQQGASLICASDRQLFTLREIHTLHLSTQARRWNERQIPPTLPSALKMDHSSFCLGSFRFI